MPTWYHSAVLHGDKQGRKISFPTVNLDSKIWPEGKKPGVYSAKVKIGEHHFLGALYFGPRTMNQETYNVLEIFLLEFPTDKQIYGQQVSFSLHQFIRPVIHFQSLDQLKDQISQDVQDVRQSFK
ncbi:MAG: hypothetical protein COY81_02485 [Candidatus Pacebacteria bacterium CG_4_10_14_0_8_um_filter_43_12]|nr:MAG: hypothetical protein COY81_02485 [Candidatus Pacebacteria bacterium CG_4_10_14_0_8_um_filter_43_12]